MTDPKVLDCLQYLAAAGLGAVVAWLLSRFKRK